MGKNINFPPTINGLDGVISFIYYNYRSKLNVKASSTNNGPPFNIVDPTKIDGTINSIWHSNLQPYQNITIYINIPLLITNYTLKSRPDNTGYPQSWVLDGSNNGDKWERLDTVNGETALIGKNKQKTFQCDHSGVFKIFRFTLTNVCTDNNWGFVLYKVELFGKLLLNLLRTHSVCYNRIRTPLYLITLALSY